MKMQTPMFDWNQWREQFPVTKNYIYMNHAGIAPLSLRVRNAMREFLDNATDDGAVHAEDWAATAEACRQSAAKLIHANTNEMAFMKNTTQGILLAANGIDWHEGDNVVTTAVEFPANVYPWWSLKERYGVETRMVAELDGRISLNELEATIDSRTRVLTISHVEFASGFRHDIQSIGEICREKGIWFVVDAIQSVGVIDVDVKACDIDILAADGHKWLCAPEGAAIFYCAEERQDQLINTNLGWAGVVDPRDFLNYNLTPKPDATRFEEGSYNSIGLFGLHAAIDLLLKIGVPQIEQRVLDLTGRLIEGLRCKGYQVSTPTKESERSGIVVFCSDRYTTSELYQMLQRANVVSAERRGLRLSPHYYNTTEEIERVLDILP